MEDLERKSVGWKKETLHIPSFAFLAQHWVFGTFFLFVYFVSFLDFFKKKQIKEAVSFKLYSEN